MIEEERERNSGKHRNTVHREIFLPVSYKWVILQLSNIQHFCAYVLCSIKNHFKCFAMLALYGWIFSMFILLWKKSNGKNSYKYDSFRFKPYSMCLCFCCDAMLNLFHSQAIWYTLRSHPIRLFQAVLDFIPMLSLSFFIPSLHTTTSKQSQKIIHWYCKTKGCKLPQHSVFWCWLAFII